jgi:hypothetical protein
MNSIAQGPEGQHSGTPQSSNFYFFLPLQLFVFPFPQL